MKFKGYSSPITVMEQTPALDVVAIGLEDGTIDILNLKVDVIESEEGPAMGGAMLAAVACGEYASVEEIANKVVKIVDTVEPDPELVAKYEARYAQFKEIYPTCKPLFEKLL